MIEYYKIGKLLDLCVELSKLVASNQCGADLYRYAKIVDTSERGFNCKNASMISNIIEKNDLNDPRYHMILEQLRLLSFDFSKKIEESIEKNNKKLDD